MKIYLEKYNWFYKDNIRVTGYILEHDKIIRDKNLIDYFNKINTIIEFENRLNEANGQFSVIIERKDEIWAACDRVRNYPLFYTHENNEIIISDNCYNCLKIKSSPNINDIAADAFLTAGYVPNNLTLIDDIYQVEAGSFVVLGNKVFAKFYYNSIDTPVIDLDPETVKKGLRDLLESVFSTHLNIVKDKFIAVSLSGGYDSRLIALMAKKYHPENLLCFTYGRKNNPEAARAEIVAKSIGVKWINIEYNNDLIKNFLNDDVFQGYYPYASNLTSMFFMSDYFAIKYLKDNLIVPDDCVFIPGHTGGITGSHLTIGMDRIATKNVLTNLIYRTHFTYVRIPGNRRSALIDLIGQRIPAIINDPWKIFEAWNRQERQAKFIINSTNVYTWFGYEYFMPLLDNSLMDFFSKLPLWLKAEKRLYHDVLKNSFFNDLNLNFKSDIMVSSFKKQFQQFKDSVKPFLPYAFVTLLSNQKNIVFYDEITKEFRKNMGEKNVIRPVQANIFNSYLIQWYLFRTREFVNSL